MDRQTALEILDALRPGEAEALDPAALEALRTLEGDAEAAALLRRRGEIDRSIAAALRDVPIPAGAKQRLLAELRRADRPVERLTPATVLAPAALAPAAAAPAGPAPSRTGSKRRAWRVAASAVALLLMAAGVAWRSLFSPPPLLTTEDLRQAAAPDVVLPWTSAGTEFDLPANRAWTNGRISVSLPPQTALLAGDSHRTAAAYAFEVHARRRSPVKGLLVVAPAARVSNPPQETAFSARAALYVGGRASVAWVEGDFVFVCVVEGGDDALRLLEEVLDVRIS